MNVLRNLFGGTHKIASTEIAVKDGKGKAVTLDTLPHGFQYSTTEQWTGKYWIDGKKIYTKTLTVPSFKNADKLIPHNVANIGDYRTTDFANSYLKAGTSRYHLPRISRGNANQQVAVNVTLTQLEIVVGSDAGFDGGYVTIRYTCTNR